MRIKINPKQFQSEFIGPILDINKAGKTALFCEDSEIYTTFLADDGSSVSFYQRYIPLAIQDPIQRVNVDLNKLSQGLNCITSNPESIILVLEDKKIKYKDHAVHFEIRTLEN